MTNAIGEITPTLYPDILPKHTRSILLNLDRHEWRTVDGLEDGAARHEEDLRLRAAQRNLGVMRQAGLVERRLQKRVPCFRLSLLGERLQSTLLSRPSLYTDLVHFLFYSLYESQLQRGEAPSGWSWAYQATCRLLWEAQPSVPSIPILAATLRGRLVESFPDSTGGVHLATPKTIIYWLRELDPSFLFLDAKERRSAGRTWCSPELFALSIDRLYRVNNLPYGTPLRLTEEVYDEIVTLCLLDSSYFEELLNVTLSTVLTLRLHSGEWGRAIIAEQALDLEGIV